MKRIRFCLVVSCLFAGSLAQATPYGMGGCGLGSLIFEKNDWTQILAATTNDSTFSQGFGISSGTSNCLPPEKSQTIAHQEDFIIHNLDTLSREMAQGQGQSIRSLAATFHCSNDALPVFSSHMRDSYPKIFSAPGAIAILNAIKEEVKTHEDLASSCPLALI